MYRRHLPQLDGGLFITDGGLETTLIFHQATELDDGDPAALGERHAALRDRLPRVNVLGGCCGTDHRHVTSIYTTWLADAAVGS
jgi:S-methylmethionine-dependent homocysteine/selenocysteine methylase